MASVCELSGVRVMNSLSAENCKEKAKQEMRASSCGGVGGGPGSMNVCPPTSLISWYRSGLHLFPIYQAP